jgi:hypothetical protein
MNALICSTILVCSTLLSPGGSPIKSQLLEPTEPISLKPENKALMAEVAAAQKEQAMIRKYWEAEPKAKRDYTRLREITPLSPLCYPLNGDLKRPTSSAPPQKQIPSSPPPGPARGRI